VVVLFDQGGLELFPAPVCVFDSVSSHEILEFDRRLGGTSSLLHDAEGKHLVWFSIKLERHAILDIRGVDCHTQSRCGRTRDGRIVASDVRVGAESTRHAEKAHHKGKLEHHDDRAEGRRSTQGKEICWF
jgi:hypothetical protein